MSAPLKLNAGQLRRLTATLEALTALTVEHQVYVDGYGTAAIVVDDITVEFRWDRETEQYALDDWIGS